MILTPATVYGGSYGARGVVFDGTNDYLRRASELTGIADGKTGLVSVWVKPATTSSGNIITNGASSAGEFFRVFVGSDIVGASGSPPGGGSSFSMTSTAVVDVGNWHHVLIAWDSASSSNCKVYVDGADATNGTPTANNTNIDYTRGSWNIGARGDGTVKLNADIAELWFATSWLDITVTANREKFAKNGRPVSLGADGSKPTGSTPIVYMKGEASAWGTNYGSGGDFTVNGALADSATKPSY